MCTQRRFWSACTFAQSDQNPHWAYFGQPRMQTFWCRQWRLWSDGAEVQVDLNLCWEYLSEGMRSCVMAHSLWAHSTVFDLITAHTPISAQSRNSVVFRLQPVYFFSLLLYKGICCGYSFELHRLVNAIQMSSHNICFYKENQKKNRIIIIK